MRSATKRNMWVVGICCGLAFLTILSGCSSNLLYGVSSSSRLQMTHFYSDSLHKSMQVEIYLPPLYTADKRYPVLYVLHGKDGTASSWMNGYWGMYGIHIDQVADRLIAAHKLQPLIIVSPEIDNSYGVNTSLQTESVDGYSRGMYENYIIKDLIPYIDAHFSTVRSRSGRYIGGFSMGGFAALHNAFLHPDLFSKAGGLSAALWVGGLPQVLSWIYPTYTDQLHRDPITIASQRNVRGVKVFLDDGKQDPFAQANRYLYEVLRRESVSVDYYVHPGSHNYTYWQTHATEFISFFAGIKQ